MGVLILKPPEALSEGTFDLTFHRIHFVTSNPLLPLKLRISYAPRLGERRPCRHAFPFLQLQVPRTNLSLWIRSTIISHIIRPRSSIVALYLHHLAICIRPWSLKLLHGKLRRMEEEWKGLWLCYVIYLLQLLNLSYFFNKVFIKIWGTVVEWGPQRP